MEKKILIPVDFSEYSHKAIVYACALNDTVYHELDLIHVFPESKTNYKNSFTNQDLIDPRIGSAKRDMQAIVSQLVEADSARNINVIFKNGDLYDEIKKLCNENSYDAIVMGTKGASGLDALLSGSNMYDVLMNTSVPILAVPLHYDTKLDKVGLLCNFKDGEIDALRQATNLLGKDFGLTLIHVNTEDEDIKKIDQKFKEFIERVIKATGIDDISYVVKNQEFFIQYKENISHSIDSVLRDEQIDIVLVTKSKKSFFRKIIEENIVRKIALQIPVPVFFAKR